MWLPPGIVTGVVGFGLCLIQSSTTHTPLLKGLPREVKFAFGRESRKTELAKFWQRKKKQSILVAFVPRSFSLSLRLQSSDHQISKQQAKTAARPVPPRPVMYLSLICTDDVTASRMSGPTASPGFPGLLLALMGATSVGQQQTSSAASQHSQI